MRVHVPGPDSPFLVRLKTPHEGIYPVPEKWPCLYHIHDIPVNLRPVLCHFPHFSRGKPQSFQIAARNKYKQNSLAGFGNVDLTLTKSLGEKIQIGGFGNEYEVFSKDKKFDEITEKYGDENFNLDEKQTKELLDRALVYAVNEALNFAYE